MSDIIFDEDNQGRQQSYGGGQRIQQRPNASGSGLIGVVMKMGATSESSASKILIIVMLAVFVAAFLVYVKFVNPSFLNSLRPGSGSSVKHSTYTFRPAPQNQ